MKKRKLLAILLSVLVVSFLIVGCDKKIYITTGLEDTEIFKLSGEACRLSEVMLVLMTEKSRYEKELGKELWLSSAENDETTLEDEIKLRVKNEMVELKSIVRFADNQNVELSEEEKADIHSAAEEFMATLDEKQIQVMDVTLEDVESLYTSFYKADKVYDKLTADAKVEVSDEEARVIEVNYIFIATCRLDENNKKIQYTDEELATVKEKIKKIQEQINSGSDFISLAEQYSDSQEYSRIFARGEMVESFEKKAFELQQDEISPVVQTDDGYYFIYCVSDYLKAETEVKKAEMENDIRKAAYDDVYIPFKGEQTLEFNSDVWEGIKLSDYETINTMELYNIYNKWMLQ